MTSGAPVIFILGVGVILGLLAMMVVIIRRHSQRRPAVQTTGRAGHDPMPPTLLDFADARALAALIGQRYPTVEARIESRRIPGHPVNYVVVFNGHAVHDRAEWQTFVREMETPQHRA